MSNEENNVNQISNNNTQSLDANIIYNKENSSPTNIKIEVHNDNKNNDYNLIEETLNLNTSQYNNKSEDTRNNNANIKNSNIKLQDFSIIKRPNSENLMEHNHNTLLDDENIDSNLNNSFRFLEQKGNYAFYNFESTPNIDNQINIKDIDIKEKDGMILNSNINKGKETKNNDYKESNKNNNLALYRRTSDKCCNILEEEKNDQFDVHSYRLKLDKKLVLDKKDELTEQQYQRTLFIYFVAILIAFSLLVFLFFYIHFGTYHVEVLINEKCKFIIKIIDNWFYLFYQHFPLL